MRYAIIKISEAESKGISSDSHLKKKGYMIVNEKELLYSDIEISSTKLYSGSEIKLIIKKDGYKL